MLRQDSNCRNEIAARMASSLTTRHSPRPIMMSDSTLSGLPTQQRTDRSKPECNALMNKDALSVTPSIQSTSQSLNSQDCHTPSGASPFTDFENDNSNRFPCTLSKQVKKATHASNEKRRRLDTTCLIAEIAQLLPQRLGHDLRTALVGILPEDCKTMKNLESTANNSETARNAVLELVPICLRDLQMESSKLQKEYSKQTDELRRMQAALTHLKLKFPTIYAQIFPASYGKRSQSQMSSPQDCSLSQYSNPSKQARYTYNSNRHGNLQPNNGHTPPSPSPSPNIDTETPTTSVWSRPSTTPTTCDLAVPSIEVVDHHHYHHSSPDQHQYPTSASPPTPRDSSPGHERADYVALLERCKEITIWQLPIKERIHKEQEAIWMAREGKRTEKGKRGRGKSVEKGDLSC